FLVAGGYVAQQQALLEPLARELAELDGRFFLPVFDLHAALTQQLQEQLVGRQIRILRRLVVRHVRDVGLPAAGSDFSLVRVAVFVGVFFSAGSASAQAVRPTMSTASAATNMILRDIMNPFSAIFRRHSCLGYTSPNAKNDQNYRG